jgi:peroxiredoxin
MRTPLPLALLLVCLPLAAQQDAIPAGHSHQGEAFNEGPRQRAHAMAGTGAVHFAATTDDESAQRFIDQGVGQLHGFWYFEAERSFRQAAAIDTDCALAYWGMAMANVDNEARAPGFARAAWKRREACSRRERLHIEALARFWAADGEAEPAKKEQDAKEEKRSKDADRARRQRLVEDLEEIVGEFPDDVESKAFLVNQIWLNWRDADMAISSKQANQALLDQIFARAPMHPAHHYQIHLWDEEKTAARSVGSAARCGQSAPGVAHMWHMGGHTFDKLRRYADGAWQQEASARVDHAHMMRDRVLPDQIFNYAHNNEWLVRSLGHVGRIHDALALAKNMVELPRHPKHNVLEGEDRSGSARYGRRRLLEVLERFELWGEVERLANTMYLDEGASPLEQGKREYLLARAALAGGETARAETACAALDELIAREKSDRAAGVDQAEEEALASTAETREAMRDALAEHEDPLRDLRRLRARLDAFLALADGAGEAKDALAALAEADLFKTHRARAHLAAGDREQAEKLAREAVDEDKGKAEPLAVLAHVLWECDARAAALATFDELRALSAAFDLDAPMFARLRPLAAERGLPDDWRVAPSVPEDAGERPPLDSLGPLHWTPPLADDWRLPDASGREVALADYHGRPVLVIFFLGFGCVHCVEQLQAFKPVAADFREAGIEIVTIGSDSLAQLAASLANGAGEDGGYPFPILADPALEAFQQWRCHDDFEKVALHGTFLIDADRRIRWQDIGHEPFVDTGFLLREARRLLALPAR